jgi:Fe2+ or Zn2+ uptake regulation protein
LDGRADHPSARQIYSGLAGRGVRLSLATVYNTLSRLVGLGMLRELQFDESYNRYDTNLETHLNLVCTTCGAITDCRGAPPVGADEILEQLGFETFTFRLEYHGVCATCRSGLRREQ